MRRFRLLLFSYRKISYYFGAMMLVLAVILLAPLALLLFDQAESGLALPFVFSSLIALGLYLICARLIGRRESNSLSFDEAAVTISLTWLFTCAVSALPLVFLNRMSFPHACFEAMSGYTTTGLTLIDFSRTPDLIFLWRSIMQLVGGAGIAFILIALVNTPYGPGLSTAEGKADLLVPHIQRSSRLVMVIYSTYACLGIFALKIAGMAWFDSVIHSFGAVSTGGFSNHPESIAWYHSVGIEAVTLVLMLLGSLNFLTAFLLFRGKVKTFLNNGEIKVQAILIPLATVFAAALFATRLYGSVPHGLRISLYETVSALTTTGYTATSYVNWPGLGLMILTLLMLIGGGANSTAGGIKQYRLFFMFKSVILKLKEITSPRERIVRISYWWGENKYLIDNALINSLFLYLVFYFGIYVLGSLAMMAAGFSVQDALFEFASTLSNSGLSVGITSVDLPLYLIWAQTLAMFLGRLEIMIVIVAVAKVVRDLKRLSP